MHKLMWQVTKRTSQFIITDHKCLVTASTNKADANLHVVPPFSEVHVKREQNVFSISSAGEKKN